MITFLAKLLRLPLARKLENLQYDRDWWRKQAVAREEHVEYWQGISKYYREKWHEALALLPEDKVLELTGNQDLIHTPPYSTKAHNHSTVTPSK